MGILRALGLGKDPHIEWLIEEFRAQPKEIVANRLYEGTPKSQQWLGDAHGEPLTFYTDARNKFQGASGVYLGKAGPQFMEGVSDYRCYFYRPSETPELSIDDERWVEAVEKAKGDPDWTDSFPEEAFGVGAAVGPFAIVLDCPLDSRPVFPHVKVLREILRKVSDAVDSIYIYEAGVGVGFGLKQLTREKLVSDIKSGVEILRLTASIPRRSETVQSSP